MPQPLFKIGDRVHYQSEQMDIIGTVVKVIDTDLGTYCYKVTYLDERGRYLTWYCSHYPELGITLTKVN